MLLSLHPFIHLRKYNKISRDLTFLIAIALTRLIDAYAISFAFLFFFHSLFISFIRPWYSISFLKFLLLSLKFTLHRIKGKLRQKEKSVEENKKLYFFWPMRIVLVGKSSIWISSRIHRNFSLFLEWKNRKLGSLPNKKRDYSVKKNVLGNGETI